MIEYTDESGDTWADYQIVAARRDTIEAVAELLQLNFGNAGTLLARAWRYCRLAHSNREQVARARLVATNASGD